MKDQVAQQLATSDQINSGDLFRFYTKSGLKELDTTQFNYKDAETQLKEAAEKAGADSTSVLSQNDGVSTADLYKTQTYQEIHGTATTDSTAATK